MSLEAAGVQITVSPELLVRGIRTGQPAYGQPDSFGQALTVDLGVTTPTVTLCGACGEHHARRAKCHLIRQYISETVSSASTTLLTAGAGADRLTHDRVERVFPWIVRLPGLFLVLIGVSACRWIPQWAPGRLASLTVAVPLPGFPLDGPPTHRPR